MTSKQALGTFSLALFLFAAPALAAGTCDGGPEAGLPCSRQSDCASWCNGGPLNHTRCTNAFECGATCEGGTNHGRNCTADSQCRPGGFCHVFLCQTFFCILNPSIVSSPTDRSAVCTAAPVEWFAQP